MPTAYKVLGQVSPTANTDTNIYTCPAATQTVVSTMTVCNRSSSAASFRIAVRPSAAAIANQHYIAFDVESAANSITALTLGITLGASDVITVRSNSANLSFSTFGSEIS